MQIAIVGYGNVGSALAEAFRAAGHRVTFAVAPDRRDRAAAAIDARPALADVALADPDQAVAVADLVVLAIPFGALDATLAPRAGALSGKVVVDATNPVGPGLVHGLGSQRSGAEHVADLLPGSRVAKAFSVYGFENLAAAPKGPGGLRPAMPYAADDPVAREVVAGLIAELGWEPFDAGGLAAAVDLEHLALLWVRHVRMGGRSPQLVWAALRAEGGLADR